MEETSRFVGLDIHKRPVMVAAVNDLQKVMIVPQKVAIQHFPIWSQSHLLATDQVALEATSNAWEIHDQLQPFVASVSVANTLQLKLISSSAAKTDKQDALVLAKLLAANLLPEVWVPPQHVRELRQLTQHRSHLMSQRSALKNKLHAILHQHNLKSPVGDPFAEMNRDWWQDLPLNPTEVLHIRHYWVSLDHFGQLLTETEVRMAQLSISEHWNDDMTFLMHWSLYGHDHFSRHRHHLSFSNCQATRGLRWTRSPCACLSRSVSHW